MDRQTNEVDEVIHGIRQGAEDVMLNGALQCCVSYEVAAVVLGNMNVSEATKQAAEEARQRWKKAADALREAMFYK